MNYKKITNLFHKLLITLLLMLLMVPVAAQISYGGQPLPLYTGGGRTLSTAGAIPFVEMPPVNNEASLRRSEAAYEAGGFGSLEFAHKHHVNLTPKNSGVWFTAGSRRVWRLGIRSQGAFSLNILLAEYELPEGAQLFIYNSNQSEILGAYTHRNNSDLNLLPVQPLGGDELIIEYQEPLDAEFEGRLMIGEVNHDFRGVVPMMQPNDPKQNWHPNLVCYPEDIEPGSGVVVLAINGSTLCTGFLLNNSAEDGEPYLMTATHCINNGYAFNLDDPRDNWQNYGARKNWRYDKVAGTIVAFFGYDSPVCEGTIRGPLQMTMASANSVLIVEDYDIALLKLKEIPPVDYQPFLLGWNNHPLTQPPYHGIHHPNGGYKKVAIGNDRVQFVTTGIPRYNFADSGHLEVPSWDVGSVEPGSSGSPLLDKDKRVIGVLSGSHHNIPRSPGYYGSLHRAWKAEVGDSIQGFYTLKDFLDPADTNAEAIDGLNLYADRLYSKSSNYGLDEVATVSKEGITPLFATNNRLGYKEFAEEFYTDKTTTIAGVFITSDANNSWWMETRADVVVLIYEDNDGKPGHIIHQEPLKFSYKYSSCYYGFTETDRDMRYQLENYVQLTSPQTVKGRFYIGIWDQKHKLEGFTVMNVEPRLEGSEKQASAWLRGRANQWIKSTDILDSPMNTSLMIAVLAKGEKLELPKPQESQEPEVKAYFNKEGRRIVIDSKTGLTGWELFNAGGVKMAEGESEGNISRVYIPAGHLSAGVYVINISAEGIKKTVKVLVR